MPDVLRIAAVTDKPELSAEVGIRPTAKQTNHRNTNEHARLHIPLFPWNLFMIVNMLHGFN